LGADGAVSVSLSPRRLAFSHEDGRIAMTMGVSSTEDIARLPVGDSAYDLAWLNFWGRDESVVLELFSQSGSFVSIFDSELKEFEENMLFVRNTMSPHYVNVGVDDWMARANVVGPVGHTSVYANEYEAGVTVRSSISDELAYVFLRADKRQAYAWAVNGDRIAPLGP